MQEDPYVPSAIYAHVGSTFGTVRPKGADLVSSFVLSNAAKRSLPKAIAELLTFVGLPIPQRTIQAVLIFNHGFRPQSVTRVLSKFQATNLDDIDFHRKPIYGGETKETNVYCKGKPSMEHLRYLRAMLDDARHMLNKDDLGRTGERYARLWLKTHGFVEVTQEKNLGQVTISSTLRTKARKAYRKSGKPEHSLDMIATEKKTGIRFGVSVKNQRGWMTRGKSAMADVITKAKAHKREPMLFVPFPDAGTIERCREDGIRLETMGAQIVPAVGRHGRVMKNVVNDLRPVIGPQPFTFLPKRDRTERSI